MRRIAYTAGGFDHLFGGRGTILLSASEPRLNTDLVGEELEHNQRYFSTRALRELREAVIELCRFAFRNDVRIVLHRRPEIVPLVLAAARQFDAGTEPLVIVFDSEYFHGRVPAETRRLGDWTRGVLAETPALRTEPQSLRFMREQMLTVPNLIAGFFVGGMDDVFAEGELCRDQRPNLRRFAFSSTGSAARRLDEERCVDQLPPDAEKATSYPHLVHELFVDLKILSWPRVMATSPATP